MHHPHAGERPRHRAAPPPRNKDGLTNHIRRLRAEHGGMTQQTLAVEVDVTRQTIVALESGRYSPSLPLAIRIARIFGRRVEEVFDLDWGGES